MYTEISFFVGIVPLNTEINRKTENAWIVSPRNWTIFGLTRSGMQSLLFLRLIAASPESVSLQLELANAFSAEMFDTGKHPGSKTPAKVCLDY